MSERALADARSCSFPGLSFGFVVQRAGSPGRRVPSSTPSTGPAVEWPDGTHVWYWDGVEIPTRIAERRDSLTPAQIAAIPNQEVRRLVLERVGWERFLESARRVAQDDFGTLWDPGISLDGERLRVVEVVNATQEPDGTHRRYLLRVPPTTRTARQGVAWTFGYENTDDYILAAAS